MASEYHTQRLVEFSDTDMAGMVHFSRFFFYMEAAEHEFLRSLGLSVHLERDGEIISWPRLSASCEYVHPLRFEDLVHIHLRVVKKGTKSLTYGFSFLAKGVEVARGQLGVVCCRCNPGEPLQAIPIPAFIAAQIEAYSRESA